MSYQRITAIQAVSLLEPNEKKILEEKLKPLLAFKRNSHLNIEYCFKDLYCIDDNQKNYIQAIDFIDKKIKEQAEYISMLESWINIPARFRQKTFENFIEHCQEAKNNKKFVMEYGEKFQENVKNGKNLLLLGNIGTGKTHLIYSLSRFIVNKYGVDVKYRYMIDVLDQIKGAYGAKKKDRYDYSTLTVDCISSSLLNASLLVIDEVGVQYGTDHEQNVVYKMINDRYLAEKPTIIISNCNVSELTTVMGERSISRLKENADVLIFRFPDQRGNFK